MKPCKSPDNFIHSGQSWSHTTSIRKYFQRNPRHIARILNGGGASDHPFLRLLRELVSHPKRLFAEPQHKWRNFYAVFQSKLTRFIGWTTWLKLHFQSTTASLFFKFSFVESVHNRCTRETDIRSPWGGGRGCVCTRRNPLPTALNPFKCWTLLRTIPMFIYSIRNTGDKCHRLTLKPGTYCVIYVRIIFQKSDRFP